VDVIVDVDVDAAGSTGASAGVSEDIWEIPATMQRYVVPRRRAAPIEPRAISGAASRRYEALLGEPSERCEIILADPKSDPALVEAFRVSGHELATATPEGAATGVAMLLFEHMQSKQKDLADVVDSWVAARGVVFATAATLELSGIAASQVTDGANVATSVHLHRETWSWQSLKTCEIRFEIAVRLRRHLAAASAADYAAACDVIAEYRAGTPDRAAAKDWQRLITSFLVPERTEWVDEDVAGSVSQQDHLTWCLRLCSVSTASQADQAGSSHWRWISGEPRALWTALDGAGADLLPALVKWLGGYIDGDGTQRILGLIALLPSDEALRLLIDNVDKKYYPAAVLAGAKRFPRRALRLLADSAGAAGPRGQAAADTLRLHALANEGLVREELPHLAPAARARVEEILAANVRLPEADAAGLPALLVSPPWLTEQKPQKPLVITGLTPKPEAAMAWRGAEEKTWSGQRAPQSQWRHKSVDELLASAATSTPAWYDICQLLNEATDEQIRPTLAHWEPDGWQADQWARPLVGRFGIDALPPILHLARKQPAANGALLLPFACSEVVPLVTDWLARVKTARVTAIAWLNRHPGVAARALIPVAVGKAGRARDAAELALRILAGNGFAQKVTEAAAGYGAEAAAAVAAVLADDGSLRLPKAMPGIPAWADAAVLPQIALKAGNESLPGAAVDHLVLMLAISKPGAPYVGVRQVREICDPASLAAFAWALFQGWRAAGYAAKESWAFDALRWFGDDECVRRLSPMIRLWPGEGGHTRAVAGLDVLASIGGGTALMHLYGISQKAKFKGLKDKAVERIAEIADDLGLTGEQLGDRLVPDLGLDANGGLALDYGPRRFTVGFDEQLKPYVADEAGKRLKALPKPGVKDDGELAPAAYQRFSGLKKDVRTMASDQFARMELAMVDQRRWTGAEFREFFVAHPLLRHIVRRLVWATFAEVGVDSGVGVGVDSAVGGAVTTTFRVAEDLSFADVDDETVSLADDAVVGIAHPVHLGEDLAAWSDVFADYEILQPFPQLGRPVFTLTPEEAASTNLTRFTKIEIPVGKVVGLERRGWRRAAPADAGVQNYVWRPLPGDRALLAPLEPGIPVGAIDAIGDHQTFTEVYLGTEDSSGYAWYDPKADHPMFDTLDAVTVSEILRDLNEVTAQ
jgi:hypothetical protein